MNYSRGRCKSTKQKNAKPVKNFYMLRTHCWYRTTKTPTLARLVQRTEALIITNFYLSSYRKINPSKQSKMYIKI